MAKQEHAKESAFISDGQEMDFPPITDMGAVVTHSIRPPDCNLSFLSMPQASFAMIQIQSQKRLLPQLFSMSSAISLVVNQTRKEKMVQKSQLQKSVAITMPLNRTEGTKSILVLNNSMHSCHKME